MRFFDYSITQLINYDLLIGFKKGFTNASTFPLLAFYVRRAYVFNFSLFHFFLRRFSMILSYTWLVKGCLGVILDREIFFSPFSRKSFHQFIRPSGFAHFVSFFEDKWIPGKLLEKNTWKNSILDMSFFPHLVLNLDTSLARSLWVEGSKSGIPVISLVDSNSKLSTASYFLMGNSKSLSLYFFFVSFIYKLMVKILFISKFNYNQSLQNFYLKQFKNQKNWFFYFARDWLFLWSNKYKRLRPTFIKSIKKISLQTFTPPRFIKKKGRKLVLLTRGTRSFLLPFSRDLKKTSLKKRRKFKFLSMKALRRTLRLSSPRIKYKTRPLRMSYYSQIRYRKYFSRYRSVKLLKKSYLFKKTLSQHKRSLRRFRKIMVRNRKKKKSLSKIKHLSVFLKNRNNREDFLIDFFKLKDQKPWLKQYTSFPFFNPSRFKISVPSAKYAYNNYFKNNSSLLFPFSAQAFNNPRPSAKNSTFHTSSYFFRYHFLLSSVATFNLVSFFAKLAKRPSRKFTKRFKLIIERFFSSFSYHFKSLFMPNKRSYYSYLFLRNLLKRFYNASPLLKNFFINRIYKQGLNSLVLNISSSIIKRKLRKFFYHLKNSYKRYKVRSIRAWNFKLTTFTCYHRRRYLLKKPYWSLRYAYSLDKENLNPSNLFSTTFQSYLNLHSLKVSLKVPPKKKSRSFYNSAKSFSKKNKYKKYRNKNNKK